MTSIDWQAIIDTLQRNKPYTHEDAYKYVHVSGRFERMTKNGIIIGSRVKAEVLNKLLNETNEYYVKFDEQRHVIAVRLLHTTKHKTKKLTKREKDNLFTFFRELYVQAGKAHEDIYALCEKGATLDEIKTIAGKHIRIEGV